MSGNVVIKVNVNLGGKSGDFSGNAGPVQDSNRLSTADLHEANETLVAQREGRFHRFPK